MSTDIPREILELRVHGINNTSPPNMLDLPEDGIRQVDGDQLGSFWRPTPEARATLTPGDRGYVPDHIEREAYSWGGLARSSFSAGTGTLGKIVAPIARVLWTMLLPFGLVNVAYWSRRLHHERVTPDAEPVMLTPKDAGGAWAIRLAGLALTLLTTATAAVVFLDYLGVQCFGSAGARCANIPDWASGLYERDLGERLVILGLGPIGLMLALYALSSATRTKFESATRGQAFTSDKDPRMAESDQAQPRWPLLSTPGFWNHARATAQAANIHLAAAVAFVVLLISWHYQAVLNNAADWGITSGQDRRWIWLAYAVAAFVLLLAALVLLMRMAPLAADIGPVNVEAAMAPGRASGRSAFVLLILGLLLLAAMGLTSWTSAPTPGNTVESVLRPRQMVGLSAAPDILIAILIGLAAIGVTLRATSRRVSRALTVGGRTVPRSVRVVANTLPGIALGILIVTTDNSVHIAQTPLAALWVAVAVAAAHVVWSLNHEPDPARATAIWSGAGPGVVLTIALLFCQTIASAFVVIVGDVLNGPHSAATLAGVDESASPARLTRCPAECVEPTLVLGAPRPYVWHGVATAFTIGLVLVLFAIVWAVNRKGSRLQQLAEAGSLTPIPGLSPRRGAPMVAMPIGGAVERAVLKARESARYAHRAEKMLAALAIFGGVSSAIAFQLSVSIEQVGQWDWVAAMLSAGTWVLALVGAGIVAMAAGGGTAGSAARPLGLLWDLMCFLPRAAHPLGPPCYGERVVPELLGRYRFWLTEEGTIDASNPTELLSSPRRIVVSAHSLGAVLSVSSLLAITNPTARDRISLLTYGVQLRAYFSRFFPELLGAEVLGTRPVLAAGLFTPDPWAKDKAKNSSSATAPPAVRPRSARSVLGGYDPKTRRWISLWRQTDYLGFPVIGYPATDPLYPGTRVLGEWYADEVDDSAYLLAVLTHGEYPRTRLYEAALLELAPAPAPPAAAPAAPGVPGVPPNPPAPPDPPAPPNPPTPPG